MLRLLCVCRLSCLAACLHACLPSCPPLVRNSSNCPIPHPCPQDWRDIDMAIAAGVDFISLSFVKSAGEIKNLKSYVESRAERRIDVIAMVRKGGVGWWEGVG